MERMKTVLKVMERLTVLQILPQEGNFVMLKVLRGLNDKVGFKDEEFKELSLVQEGNAVKWNIAADIGKEFDFGEKETDLIKDSLKKLDEQKKLEQRHFTLYEKFMEEK